MFNEQRLHVVAWAGDGHGQRLGLPTEEGRVQHPDHGGDGVARPSDLLLFGILNRWSCYWPSAGCWRPAGNPTR